MKRYDPAYERLLDLMPLDDLRLVSVTTVSNASCSYCAFEVTVGVDPNVPDGLELLNYVAKAGYGGIASSGC
jgi:hypothetical protein